MPSPSCFTLVPADESDDGGIYLKATVLILAAIVLLSFSGCGGGVSGESVWLAIHDADTLTVEEAYLVWQGFDDEQKALFLGADTVGVELTRSIAMRGILVEEIRDAGYLDDPWIEAFGRAWLRTEASVALTDLMLSRIQSEIDSTEIAFCAEHLNDSVWLSASDTLSGRVDFGCFSLAELPCELARAIDSTDDSLFMFVFEPEFDSLTIRCDSMTRGARVEHGTFVMADGSADSTSLWTLAQGRIRFWRLCTQKNLISEYGVFVDTTAVDRLASFYSGASPLVGNDTVFSSVLGSFTSMELSREIAFFQTRLPLRSDQREWILAAIDNILLQSYLASELASQSPAAMDSLQTEVFNYTCGLAVDSMRKDSILSSLMITEEDLQYEFDNLETPQVTPEFRILMTAVLSPADTVRYREASESGSLEEFLNSLPGIDFFQDPGAPPGVTRPLRESDLPPSHTDAVFSAQAGDSSWIGPFLLDPIRGSVFYRVIETIPEHPATLDELRPQLEIVAKSRVEIEATEQWLLRMADRHGLRLNIDAILQLPADPGDWGTARR